MGIQLDVHAQAMTCHAFRSQRRRLAIENKIAEIQKLRQRAEQAERELRSWWTWWNYWSSSEWCGKMVVPSDDVRGFQSLAATQLKDSEEDGVDGGMGMNASKLEKEELLLDPEKEAENINYVEDIGVLEGEEEEGSKVEKKFEKFEEEEVEADVLSFLWKDEDKKKKKVRWSEDLCEEVPPGSKRKKKGVSRKKRRASPTQSSSSSKREEEEEKALFKEEIRDGHGLADIAESEETIADDALRAAEHFAEYEQEVEEVDVEPDDEDDAMEWWHGKDIPPGCFYELLIPEMRRASNALEDVGEREISYWLHSLAGNAVLRAPAAMQRDASKQLAANLAMNALCTCLKNRGAKLLRHAWAEAREALVKNIVTTMQDFGKH